MEEKAKIDDAAGAKRREYLTVEPGQEMTYLKKAEDAQAYIDAGYPGDASPYPWVDAEATARSLTPTQVADDIKAQHDAWEVVGIAIEAIRIAAKKNIDAASTVSAVRNFAANAVTNIEAQ